MAGFHGTIISDEYPATVAMQCVMIVIPEGDEYLRLLAGLLNLAGEPSSYDDPESVQTEGLCFAWDESYFLTEWLNCGEPPGEESMNSAVILFPDRASVTSGAVIAWVSNTGSSLAGYFQQSPALTGDSYRWEFYLARGRYNVDMIFLRGTGNGRGDIEVYDESLTLIAQIAVDLRGAAQANTVLGGAFDLPVGGKIRVTWKGTGSSGAGFIRPVQRIMIDKYADL